MGMSKMYVSLSYVDELCPLANANDDGFYFRSLCWSLRMSL